MIDLTKNPLDILLLHAEEEVEKQEGEEEKTKENAPGWDEKLKKLSSTLLSDEKNKEKLEKKEAGKVVMTKEAKDKIVDALSRQLLMAVAFGENDFVSDVCEMALSAVKKRGRDARDTELLMALGYVIDDMAEEMGIEKEEEKEESEEREEFAKEVLDVMDSAAIYHRADIMRKIFLEGLRVLEKLGKNPDITPADETARLIFDDEKAREFVSSVMEEYRVWEKENGILREGKEKERGKFVLSVMAALNAAKKEGFSDIEYDILLCLAKAGGESVPSIADAASALFDNEKEREKAEKLICKCLEKEREIKEKRAEKKRKSEEEKENTASEERKEEENGKTDAASTSPALTFSLRRNSEAKASAEEFIDAAKRSGFSKDELLGIAERMSSVAGEILKRAGKEEGKEEG